MESADRPRSPSVRRTWFLSFLGLLLVPTIVGVAVYVSAAQALERQAQESTRALLGLMELEVNSKVDALGRLVQDLSNNPRVAYLATKKSMTSEDRYDLTLLSEDLVLYQRYGGSVGTFFLYFPDLDAVLAPRRFSPWKAQLDQLFPSDPGQAALFQQSLQEREVNRSLPVTFQGPSGIPVQSVAYLRTIPPGMGADGAILVVFMDLEALTKALQTRLSGQVADVMILDAGGHVLASTRGSVDRFDPKNWDQDEGLVEVAGPGGVSELFYQSIPSLGWTVALEVPRTTLWTELDTTRNWALFGLLLGFVSALFLAARLVKRNYRPIERLLGLVRDIGTGPMTGNEFSQIGQAIDHVKAEKEQAETWRERHRTVLARSLVQRLIDGRLGLQDPLAESLVGEGLLLSEALYWVVGADLPRRDLAADAVAAIHARLGDDCGRLFEGEGELRVYFLWSSPHDLEDPTELLHRAVSGFIEECRAQGLDGGHWALGSPVGSVQELPLGKQLVADALDHLLLTRGPSPLNVRDLPRSPTVSRPYDFDLEDQLRLLNATQTGNHALARSLWHEILDRNVQRPGGLEPAAYRCLRWDVASTLYRASVAVEFPEVDGTTPEKLLEDSHDPEVLRARIDAQIDAIAAWVAHQNEQRQQNSRTEANRKLVEEIRAFLQDHFADPSLNLATLANLWKISPAWLSRVFKDIAGQSILDALGGVRLEAARILLLETDAPLAEIGGRVGFTDVNTFIRVSKRMLGMTPGRFREIHRH